MIPQTSREVLNLIAKQLDKQNKKRISEYGESIDNATGYDWTAEALAECVDALQHLVKRNKELENQVKIYRTVCMNMSQAEMRRMAGIGK